VSLMPAVAPRTGPVGARTGAGTGAENGGYRGAYNGGNALPPVAVPPSEEAIETLMVRFHLADFFGLKISFNTLEKRKTSSYLPLI
jgi:hypothetical protein